MAKRPKQLPDRPGLTDQQIDRASYMGSPEHKDRRWWGGLPAAYTGADGIATRPGKQMTTVCPLVGQAERELATGWVRSALKRGQMRYYEADQVYPNHVWHRDEAGQVWFGRCLNSVQGHYKGWPIDEDERRAIFG